MRELIKSAWLIGAAVLIPLLLFMVFQSGFAAREERRAVEARALAKAENTIVRADAIVGRTLGALEALSTVRALRQGDLPNAQRRVREISAFHPDWAGVLLLRTRDRRQLFDTRVSTDRPTMTRQSLDGLRSPRLTARCPCIVIERRAPGPDGGYTIAVLLSARQFQALLPPNGTEFAVSAITTAEGRFIARSLDPQNRFGTLGSTYLRDAIRSGKASGVYRGYTLEGVENYSAFARSLLTGWSAHLALGAQLIDTPARRFLGSIGLAALLSIALAVALIWFALRQIAEGRRAAERGQQAQKLEALGQLTGGIAHDFNNLLTPVVGALDYMLKRGSLDDRARRIARGALLSAERAGKLTAQLLAFSRRQKLEIAPVNVSELMVDLQPILTQSLGKDHEVDVTIAPGALCVRSDFNQLELALLNLVINARDAMPGGGTIKVDIGVDRDDARDDIIIRVIDQGQGMDPETHRRALEPFFTTKAQGRGTGLGLAQVFGLMQQSNGSVDIDSAVGRGTTVTLRLPACDEIPPPRNRPSEGAITPAKRLRLLLVDDDAAVRATIARLFEDDGHVVDSVGDGRIAITAIKHCQYDLVIVDFAMPAMDGAAVIREARKLRPDVKFLMVTGYSDSEAVAAACPDTAVLRKPFESDALRARVAEITS